MKRTPPTQQEIENGHWDVADPPPKVISLLREIFVAFSSSSNFESQRIEVRSKIEPILAMWEQSEDIEMLRSELGVAKRGQGRKRTQATVNFECDLAFAVAEHEARGTPLPIEFVAAEAQVDERTVKNAVKRWPSIRRVVELARAPNPHASEPGTPPPSKLHYVIRKPEKK